MVMIVEWWLMMICIAVKCRGQEEGNRLVRSLHHQGHVLHRVQLLSTKRRPGEIGNWHRGKTMMKWSCNALYLLSCRDRRNCRRSSNCSRALHTSSVWRGLMRAGADSGRRSPLSKHVCRDSPELPPPSRSQNPQTELILVGSLPIPVPEIS